MAEGRRVELHPHFCRTWFSRPVAGPSPLHYLPKIVKYLMNPNEDVHFSYNILARVLCTEPYVQREHWSTDRGFKLDPILGESEFVEDGVPNQVRTGDEGTTIPSVAATL